MLFADDRLREGGPDSGLSGIGNNNASGYSPSATRIYCVPARARV
jgi:hypothetical protein